MTKLLALKATCLEPVNPIPLLFAPWTLSLIWNRLHCRDRLAQVTGHSYVDSEPSLTSKPALCQTSLQPIARCIKPWLKTSLLTSSLALSEHDQICSQITLKPTVRRISLRLQTSPLTNSPVLLEHGQTCSRMTLQPTDRRISLLLTMKHHCQRPLSRLLPP
jgi:hypothetical protein